MLRTSGRDKSPTGAAEEGIDRRFAHRRDNVRHDAGGRLPVAILLSAVGWLDNLGDALTYALSLAVVSASAQAKAKVAMVKACLIAGAALAVAAQIAWRLTHPAVPIFETMGVAASLNLGANLLCLWLLTPYRHNDVNMASVWECSRNDVLEGCAVIAAALGVWFFKAGWPDLVIAVALLLLFARSAARVMRSAALSLRGSRPTSPQNA
jgi:Co/Zn/Cd efflux system component